MSDIMREAIKRHCKKYKYSAEYTLYWIENPFCEICGNHSDAPHHIRTKGAGGGDEPGNLLSLCTTHHTEIGTIGVQTFANKYPQFYDKIFVALDIECVGLAR